MITLKNKFFLKSLSVITILFSGVIVEHNANAAARVANRGGGVPRNIVVTNNVPAETVQPTPVITEVQEEIAPIQEEIIEQEEFIEEEKKAPAINKSSKFDTILSSSSTTSSSSANEFADLIKKQREAIAAQEARDFRETINKEALKIGTNQCDSDLRKCMQEKCGEKFTQCALDGATIFGDKINACKRNLKCTGEEIKLFSAEIMADRDFNVRTALYDSVVDCGKAYNGCMINECGPMFDKCLSKSSSDAAIMACKKVADKCREQDSGLAERVGVVLGKLRDYAEVDVKKDEERLYELRDLMRKSCEKIGAMFDERTFDCVFTISFFAGENAENPMASRKRYAGDSFVCTQEWFGIDVTTYKENAYRETRAQKGASSAMLGAGLGTAAAMVTSGAIQRGIDRQKAEHEAEVECMKAGKFWVNDKCKGVGETCSTWGLNGVTAIDKNGKWVCVPLKAAKAKGQMASASGNGGNGQSSSGTSGNGGNGQSSSGTSGNGGNGQSFGGDEKALLELMKSGNEKELAKYISKIGCPAGETAYDIKCNSIDSCNFECKKSK